MGSLLLDLRFAARTLLASPGYAAAAIVCFALGIGVNVTMFSAVDTLLFRPPPHVADPSHVVRIDFSGKSPVFGPYTSTVTSYPTFSDLREGVHAFLSNSPEIEAPVAIDKHLAEPFEQGDEYVYVPN